MKAFLLFLFLTIITAGSFAQQTDLDPNLLVPEIEDLIQQYQDLDIFSGVVMVAQKGVPLYHKAFGYANRSTHEINTLETLFDIGSMNKSFTKIVILQLVEAGKLSLRDRLHQYVEGFDSPEQKKITVEHLLYHRSGLGDYHSPGFFSLPDEEKSISRLAERISRLPLSFSPGKGQEYSNAGYILLGAIIEKVSGKSYFQNVRERIIEPLALKETYLEDIHSVPNRATGYYKTIKGELRDNEGMMDVPNPDGGFLSTTSDIMTFYQEYFYGHQLLSARIQKKDPFFKAIRKYRNTGAAIPQAGGYEGVNTAYYEVLRDRISIIVFANMNEPVAEHLAEGILAIIRGQKARKPSLPASQNVYEAYQKRGLDFVRNHFEELTVNFHPEDPRDLILNQLGYELLFEKEVKEALIFFQLNTELFPEVANVWDSLGEAYALNGQKNEAKKAYEKALSLDPDLDSARLALDRLKED